MKRFWIGIGVLAVLLATGLAVMLFMEQWHAPIRQELAEAAQAALAGDWTQALQSAQNADTQWQQCRDFSAAFNDHRMLEEMDCLFAKIEVYAAGRDALSFAATCAHLSRLADAIAQSHLPKWQNLL